MNALLVLIFGILSAYLMFSLIILGMMLLSFLVQILIGFGATIFNIPDDIG